MCNQPVGLGKCLTELRVLSPFLHLSHLAYFKEITMVTSQTLQRDRCRQTQARIGIRIPQKYHREAAISQLASRYDLTINILAGILSVNGVGDGWFYLQLNGNYEKIYAALTYLSKLDIAIWYDSQQEQDCW
jgi:ABC-type methionine transport system ATPase subunit